MTRLKDIEDKIKKDLTSTPTSSAKDKDVPPSTINILPRLDDAEKKIGILEKTISFVQDTNRFILIIMFMGLVAIILSAILGIIQAYNANTTTQIEYIKSTEDLKNEVNNLNAKLDAATSSGNLKAFGK